MAETAKKDVWAELSKPFPKEAVGKMPRGGIQLDYIGHAAVTDRLNNVVGPDNWNWEPYAFNEDGSPKFTIRGTQAIMWGKFTIKGVTKPCVGTAPTNKMELEKELIGDLIRNGAMRFGVALELWSKDELESNIDHDHKPGKPTIDPPAPEEPSIDVKSDIKVTPEQVKALMSAIKIKSNSRATKETAVEALNSLAGSIRDVAEFTDLTTEEGEKLKTLVAKLTPAEIDMLFPTEPF